MTSGRRSRRDQGSVPEPGRIPVQNGHAPRVGVLHPGRMGTAVAAEAIRGGAEVIWCKQGRSPATAARAAAAGLHAVATLEELLAASEIVLSICPPAFAEDVAGAVLNHRFDGLYVEANAVSRARLVRIEGCFDNSAARLLDGAIFGPPFPDETVARLYLAGQTADMDSIVALFRGTRVDVVPIGANMGAATTLKMAHSSYQKATRPLAAVALALAAKHGVAEHLRSEAARVSSSPLAEANHLPGVAARAWRWSPEMIDVADTLAAEGLPTELATAAATVLLRWEGFRDIWDLPVDAVLDGLGHATLRALPPTGTS